MGVYGYLGVNVYIDDDFAFKYSKWLKYLDKSNRKNFDSIEDILRNLCKRFLEAKDKFDQMGGTLPSCLKEKLSEYFTELKNGTKNLDIIWNIKHSNNENKYDYLPNQLHGSGLNPKADEIDIWDAYKERFWRVFEKNEGTKKVLTSSLFLHELIHSVKKANKFKCFKELSPGIEEVTTDWGCAKVFGNEDSYIGYIDEHLEYWEKDYCTYEIVCKCDNGCPDESGQGKCTPQPPDGGTKGGSGSSASGPGGDHVDDNYSSSSGILREYNLAPEAVILTSGYWQEALKFYGGLKAEPNFTAKALFDSSPFLVIPTGGLFSQENDSTLKIILREYVRLGGTIIVFAQQYGRHYEKIVPLPEGASLAGQGWREDISCFSQPYNLKVMHPALATMAAGTVVTDGQFNVYPSNSTVLLRKGANQEPVLLYYPYGQGTVILTSLYSDWAAAHSQASTTELGLVRDLITFAKNSNLPIPMFNLAENATPAINLNIAIKNNTEIAAAKAIITVYTPDRKAVLHQAEAVVSLAAGAETEIPLAFTLPLLASANLGICHTDYELYDAEGILVQMASEADSGRFTPYRFQLSPKPVKDMVSWLTIEKDTVFWDEKPHFTLHVRNNTTHAITRYFTYIISRSVNKPLTTLTVGAGQTYDYSFETEISANRQNWSESMDLLVVMGADRTAKGVRVLYPKFTIGIRTPPAQIRFGDAINFTINASNTTGKAVPMGMAVKLFKGSQEIETLYFADHAFAKDESFSYSGSYVLPAAIAPGRVFPAPGTHGPGRQGQVWLCFDLLFAQQCSRNP